MTLENVEHLLNESGITVGFDVIKKRTLARQHGKPCTILEIVSVASRYGMSGHWLLAFIDDIARKNPLNPVKDWIDSMPWDGIDRMPAILATIETAEDYPEPLKIVLVRRWLLSATAAATLEGKRFSTRGVLTLQGPQGVGKTSWIARLVPAGALLVDVIKRDHHMEGGNKDSILGAIAHWIVEIGELDGAFKRDIARLKGFLTNDCDKVRPPYGRIEVEYDRRTVFAATVNEDTFLVDPTGNSRFWTIAVTKLDFHHEVDMQQFFAQLRYELEQGEQWWLTQAEEQALHRYNLRHRAVSAIAERIKDAIDLRAIGTGRGSYMTASEVLAGIGINNPSNAQCKEGGAVLRELYGPSKRVRGRDKWRVLMKGTSDFNYFDPEDEDY